MVSPKKTNTLIMSGESPKAHCFICKEKHEIQDPSYGKTKNNHTIIQGKCGNCGRKVSTFIKSQSSQSKASDEDVKTDA